ncbi:dihydrodipicolinate synthase family protein [Sinomicrobium weinanense]|uniref:Dihydrodipicolinate synthase family protein n=1 Tax=Sinomicrobium weinanense TaxID=2842200 RepID=A0A926JTK2_9FLAO|nr:dihydrodipicolinate synthase family protein [Sinomicrobium weinanense]MBC9797119.1 dihydrodipicolinate synthase family protein [Sinomicrobium weinanense]MBU3124820.1 dihydrodipicolinate synthase family protein [Sinomicrobium weinanense]
MKYQKTNFNGLIAAGFSPFHRDGSVNVKVIPALVDDLIKKGITGFYLMGSTGEGLLLKIADRIRITEAYIEAIDGRVPVIVNVSHSSYAISNDLTRHAVETGADGVSATLQSYYPITSLNQLIYGIEKIADSQDSIPFIYYHIPGKTGLNFKMHLLLDELGTRLPQLGGIKFTSPELNDFMLCSQLHGDRYQMLFGVDELFLPALAMGADTFIGSTYNFMPAVYQNIIQEYGRGNQQEANENYFKAIRVIDTFLQYDGLAAQKAIMKMIGYDFGDPKSPVLPLSSQNYDQLYAELEKLGFFHELKTTLKR